METWGRGGCGTILTGVRVPIAAGGGWAPGGLGEAVGPLWDGAAGTSALCFRSLPGHSAEGSGLKGTTEHDKGTAATHQLGRASRYQVSRRPQAHRRKPVIGSASPRRFVIGARGLTGERSLVLGFPSVGPTCTRWLKLVGGEMSLERIKGSFSISLWAEKV